MKGEIGKETVLLLKTLVDKYDLLEKLIIKNHVYETPCILKIDVSKGHKDFLKWVETSVSHLIRMYKLYIKKYLLFNDFVNVYFNELCF